MDHLPRPQNNSQPLIRVPIVPGISYDGLGFLGFPKRQGYDFELDDEGVIRLKEDLDNVTSFVQAWLYFGLILEVFGIEIELKDFVGENPSGDAPVINSTCLATYLTRWRSELSDLQGYTRQSAVENTIQCLKVAWNSCNFFEAFTPFRSERGTCITLSIKVHINSVALAISKFTNDTGIEGLCRPPRVSTVCLLKGFAPSSLRLLYDHMILHDWCPHRASDHAIRFSYIALCYIASLLRMQRPGVSHEKCLQNNHCTAESIDEETFKFRHVVIPYVVNPCVCSSVEPCMEDVIAILEDGGFPLISFTLVLQHRPQMKVVRVTYGSDYTAISHVWVDGLGNPSTNAMSERQCLRLFKYIERVELAALNPYEGPFELLEHLYRRVIPQKYQTSLFWLDGFCIPVATNDRMSRLKQKAISLMTVIYARASRVLILDAELQQLSIQIVSREELAARIIVSSWNGRSWKFHKAAIARSKSLFFQCLGDSLDMSLLEEKIVKDETKDSGIDALAS